MYLLGTEFAKSGQQPSERFSLNTLAARLFLPSPILEPIVARLIQANLIVVAEDDNLLPGRDLAMIRLADILDAVRTADDAALVQVRSIPAADAMAQHAEAAMRHSLHAKTLKDWVSEESSKT
jgi:DNA-binding IscR family transcriptional regulator